MKKKHIFITTIIAICSFLLGVWTTTSFGSGKVNDPRLQVFIDLYNTLKENWYYGDDETLDEMMENVYGAIYDYNVDPYTYYVAAPIEGEEQEKTYIDNRMLKSPGIALHQVRKEMYNMY